MVSRSPEQFWDSLFQKEVEELSKQALPEDEALEVMRQLREGQEQGLPINIANSAASVVTILGEQLEEIWDEVIKEPGSIPIARSYGSAGIIVLATKAYLDNPDINRIATRYAAPLFRSFGITSNQPILDIGQSALRRGLESLDIDPSGFSLIRMVHNPDYFAFLERTDNPYSRITMALVRYGSRKYEEVYRQLARLEEVPPKRQ